MIVVDFGVIVVEGYNVCYMIFENFVVVMGEVVVFDVVVGDFFFIFFEFVLLVVVGVCVLEFDVILFVKL